MLTPGWLSRLFLWTSNPNGTVLTRDAACHQDYWPWILLGSEQMRLHKLQDASLCPCHFYVFVWISHRSGTKL